MTNTMRINFGAFAVTLFICTALSGEALAQVFGVSAIDHSAANPSFPAPGLDTKIEVSRYQLLVITASRSDRWSIKSSGGPTFSGNANGVSEGVPFDVFVTLGEFTFPLGALVGSLDMGKTFFAIGTQMEMTVLRPGTLRLYFWDNDFANNGGSVRVDVKIYDRAKPRSAP
jgi:hypothetical protein